MFPGDGGHDMMDNGVAWAALGTAAVAVIAQFRKSVSAYFHGRALDARKDQTQREDSFEKLFRRQEEQIGRYALALEGHGAAIRQIYGMFVNAVAENVDCHRAHDLTKAALKVLHADMVRAGLDPQPLPEFVEFVPRSPGDRDRADFLMRTVQQASEILFAADRKRKRDSDHVDSGSEPTPVPKAVGPAAGGQRPDPRGAGGDP